MSEMVGPTPQQFAAVRRVREEANNLRLACIAAADGAALLGISYNQKIVDQLPADQLRLLGALRKIN